MRLPEVVLKDCAAVIEARGWCQMSYGLNGGPVCVVGAIWETVRNGAECEAARALVERRIGSTHISGWNDAKGRTKDEVLAMLRGEPCE